MKTKVPAVTPTLKEAVKTYLMAKAQEELIRPIVEGYQTQILAEHQFKVAPEHSRDAGYVIRRPIHAYMMSAEDRAIYVQKCREQCIAHNLTRFIASPNHCPLATAEYERITAEIVVVEAGSYVAGITLELASTHERRKKAVDLTVAFVLSACPDITAESLTKGI